MKKQVDATAAGVITKTGLKKPRGGFGILLSLAAGSVVVSATLACNKSDFRGSSERLAATVTREFVQDEGAVQTEQFDQGEIGSLDLLVVIDNSGSMREEQANLSTKLQPLLSQVADSDWQISVVTTTSAEDVSGEPCQRALIKKSDPNAAELFQQAITGAGTEGSGIERGILRAVEGLQCNSWLRSGSTVAVLIVSDEDNCAVSANNPFGCPGRADADGSFLINHLSSIRSVGQDARVYGLLWDNGPFCSRNNGENEGRIYADVINRTGGRFGSICEADYTPTLNAISEDVAKILKYEMPITRDPNQGTVTVLVDGQEWTDFTLEGRLVKFTEAPPFGSKVEVNYKEQIPLKSSFEVGRGADAKSMIVKINGKKTLDFYYNAAEGVVEFDTPPPEGAEIVVLFTPKRGSADEATDE